MKVRLWLGALAAAISMAGGVPASAGSGKDAYVFIYGDVQFGNPTISQSTWMRGHLEGNNLFVHRRGRGYVVSDAAKMEEARGILSSDPARKALDAESKELSRRAREIDREMGRVDREADALGDSGDRSEAALRRREELRERQRALDGEERAADRKESELDRRKEVLERAAEARLWPVLDRWIADGTARPID